jgi:hypothetical protein
MHGDAPSYPSVHIVNMEIDLQSVFGLHVTAKMIQFMYSQSETVRPRSHFRHSFTCERLIYSHDRSTFFAHRYINVGIRNEAAHNHFWEYLFPIFVTVSLQCTCIAVLIG